MSDQYAFDHLPRFRITAEYISRRRNVIRVFNPSAAERYLPEIGGLDRLLGIKKGPTTAAEKADMKAYYSANLAWLRAAVADMQYASVMRPPEPGLGLAALGAAEAESDHAFRARVLEEAARHPFIAISDLIAVASGHELDVFGLRYGLKRTLAEDELAPSKAEEADAAAYFADVKEDEVLVLSPVDVVITIGPTARNPEAEAALAKTGLLTSLPAADVVSPEPERHERPVTKAILDEWMNR